MSRHAGAIGGGCGVVFLMGWLAFWSAGTLFFDGFCVKALYDQFCARSYPSIPGNITHSELVVEHDSEGKSERAEINYDYFVGRQKYSGDKVRFGMMGMGEARDYVSRFPVGSETPVYYDAAKPERAVLRVGFSPWDFFMPMFLMPFNMIMIGGLGYVLSVARRKLFGGTATHVRTRDLGMAIEFRIFTTSRLLMAMVAAGGIGFVGVFVFAFGQMLIPAWPLLITLWVMLFVGVAWSVLSVSPQWLEVNTLRGTLKMQQSPTRDRTIDFREVTELKASPNHGKKSFGSAKLEIHSAANENDKASKTTINCASIEDAKWLRAKLSDLIGRPDLR